MRPRPTNSSPKATITRSVIETARVGQRILSAGLQTHLALKRTVGPGLLRWFSNEKEQSSQTGQIFVQLSFPSQSGPRKLLTEVRVSVAPLLTPPVSNVECLDNVWDEAILARSAASRVLTTAHFHLV